MDWPLLNRAVFAISRPSKPQLQALLEQQKDAPYLYAEVGGTLGATLPAGYNIDRYRVRLGTGCPTYAAAKLAMQRWQMFDKRWLRVFPEETELRKGATVAVIAAHLGFYSVNISRICYVVDGERPTNNFGFAYGTLSEHAEAGEERFSISWKSDDSVHFEILAFSKPRAAIARAGYPISRMLQRRFGRTAMASMKMAVEKAMTQPE